jgi:hypothetical protein
MSFVVKGKGTAVMWCLYLNILPSTAPMQLGNCHSEYNSSPLFFHSSSIGFGNSVGDNLFQIASQVDMIIEYTVEGTIL